MAVLIPFGSAEAATLSDSADNSCAAFLVGVGGNLNVTTLNGDDVVLVGLVAGQIYPIACSKLKSTSSTATDIIKLDP
tara:strand:- start:5703 stop:5936 length:234 start_codon:yes stop_codon:yes gene_type:complete